LQIVSNVETKMAAIEEKATANFNTHIGAQIKELGANVAGLMQSMEHPPAANDEEPPPEPEAQPAAAAQPGPAGGGGGAPDQGAAPQAPPQDEMPPPEAQRRLMAGRHTKFANGQTWTQGDDGKPQRVK
jgi:hypothetical protein